MSSEFLPPNTDVATHWPPQTAEARKAPGYKTHMILLQFFKSILYIISLFIRCTTINSLNKLTFYLVKYVDIYWPMDVLNCRFTAQNNNDVYTSVVMSWLAPFARR